MSGSYRALRKLYEAVHRPAKFAVVGVINTVVDFGLFSLLVTVGGMQPVVANTCSYSAGLANSFLLNRFWTFRGVHDPAMKTSTQVWRYFLLNLVGLAISNAVVWAASGVISPLAAKGLAIFATFGWNYWTSRRFVYRGAPLTAVRDQP